MEENKYRNSEHFNKNKIKINKIIISICAFITIVFILLHIFIYDFHLNYWLIVPCFYLPSIALIVSKRKREFFESSTFAWVYIFMIAELIVPFISGLPMTKNKAEKLMLQLDSKAKYITENGDYNMIDSEIARYKYSFYNEEKKLLYMVNPINKEVEKIDNYTFEEWKN